MRKLYIAGLVVVAALVIGIAIADEIKFSTYYPAPYGMYREFDTTGKTCLATDEWGIEGANARVGIGTTDPQNTLHIISPQSGLTVQRISEVASEPAALTLYKTRGTELSPVILQDGDDIGQVRFNVFDGMDWYNSAFISSTVDGTPGVGSTPGNLTFRTTPDGSTVAVERMRIDKDGNVGIGTVSPDGKLDVVSTNSGFIPPRFATHNDIVNNITSPVEGMMAYNLADHVMEYYNDTDWVPMGGGGVSFGNWQSTDTGQVGGTGASLVKNSNYRASTDGIIHAYAYGTNTGIKGYTAGSVAGLSVKVSDSSYSTGRTSITMAVKKDDYWKVTAVSDSGPTYFIYWMPLGN